MATDLPWMMLQPLYTHMYDSTHSGIISIMAGGGGGGGGGGGRRVVSGW